MEDGFTRHFFFLQEYFHTFCFFLTQLLLQIFFVLFSRKTKWSYFFFCETVDKFHCKWKCRFWQKMFSKIPIEKEFLPRMKNDSRKDFLCVVLYFSFLKPSERARFNRTFCLSSFFFFMVDQVESFSQGRKNFSRKDYGKKKNYWRKNERNIFFLLKEKY